MTNKFIIKDAKSNPFKDIDTEEINNDEDDIGMCKLVLRKLIKDFTYERVLSVIPKQNKYLNSLLERPLDTLLKKYPKEIVDKAMEELKDEIPLLHQFDNIIIKFGRFIPNTPHIFDAILGVELASNNQHAVWYSRSVDNEYSVVDSRKNFQ